MEKKLYPNVSNRCEGLFHKQTTSAAILQHFRTADASADAHPFRLRLKIRAGRYREHIGCMHKCLLFFSFRQLVSH